MLTSSDHANSQLQQLSTRRTITADQRVPVGRLERFGRLESDVAKAGDEIRSLARFMSTQRTAFRKILKKYKKWTGSSQLEDRFREEVLDDPKSFTKLDLGPLLDDYSTTADQIRALYEKQVHQKASSKSSAESHVTTGSSTIPGLQFATDNGSKAEFDTAIATVPLGENGIFASYLVHPENIVELQVLLLQHARYFSNRSRSNSLSSPISTSPQNESFSQDFGPDADYFALEADDAERFAAEQNRLTIDEREHSPGSTPQKAKLCIRWNRDEDAQVAFRRPNNKCQYAAVKKKFVSLILHRNAEFTPRRAAATPESEQLLNIINRDIKQDRSLEPLYMFSSCRSRFVGTGNNAHQMVLATLDTSNTIQKVDNGVVSGAKSSFPFAVLLVRQEGPASGDLLNALDESHLVERVRGFSFEYYAVWKTAQSAKIPAPFWLPLLDRDIRKLPPPAIKRTPSSAVVTPSSTGSANGATDGTTAVETTRSDSVAFTSELEAPPIRAFRKKRRRGYPEATSSRDTRYWSEYDHPEEGDDDANAYTIYIDPNEKSSIDVFFDRLGQLFSRIGKTDSSGLNAEPDTPRDSESSDEDEVTTLKPRQKSYGTLATSRRTASGRHGEASINLESQLLQQQHTTLAHVRAICFVASLTILAVACLLAATGRNKLRYEVDFGVIFASACSLFFGIAGFATLFRESQAATVTWLLSILVLVIDAICSGVLLAWMLG
jgi:hypothetical protein